MKISEQTLNNTGEIVKDGRVFKPVYKHLLDNMPRDLVQEMARRHLEELAKKKRRTPNQAAESR
jgi:hypothetical protein